MQERTLLPPLRKKSINHHPQTYHFFHPNVIFFLLFILFAYFIYSPPPTTNTYIYSSVHLLHMIFSTPSRILSPIQLFFISINFFTKRPRSSSSWCPLSVIFQIANLFISICFLISTSYALCTLIYLHSFPSFIFFIYTFSDSFVTPTSTFLSYFFFNAI